MSAQPVNAAASAGAQAAVQSALGGNDAVGSVLSGGTPYGAYAQAAATGLQALSAMSGDKPNGGANVSTPNFNNAPTAIVNFGSGQISSNANPTNTQSANPASGGGGVSGALSSLTSGVGGTIALVVLGLFGIVVVKRMSKG